ncbi:MAG: prepilin peptidase [Cetobacterium sp.]|uniref:prepilin peptidase n=1 Tax=Cetobacterium sp. TaxID=2071632 RepID=UPI003F3DBD4E
MIFNIILLSLGLILLCIITIYDFKYLVIPNIYVGILTIIGIIYQFFRGELLEGIIGGSIYILPLLFIYGYVSDIFQRECLGFGDIKLMFAIGIFLSFKSMNHIFIFYNVIFFLCGIFTIFFYKKYKDKYIIPFGPILSVGGIIFYICQEKYF